VKKLERFLARPLSPDLEYCFILDAQGGHNISDLVLLTSYWKLIKYAKETEVARQKGSVTEDKQDKILHRKISAFLECVHNYDPDSHHISFLEFVANNLLINILKSNNKTRKKINKQIAQAMDLISQSERSIDEPSQGEGSMTLLETICGNLPDQEALLHQKTLSGTFSKRIFTALSKLESQVIRGLYYRENSIQEVASELGKTVTKVRSIEKKALRRIRNEIKKQRLFDDLID
jgi:RNA polymerase sigma factor (sigma-70 family)